jgi:hypothetical protein
MDERVRLCKDTMLYHCERCHALFVLTERFALEAGQVAYVLLLANPCRVCTKGEVVPLGSFLMEVNK